jgi:uncharacterized protein YceK
MPGRGLGLAVVAAVALLGGGCGTMINITNFAPAEIGGGQRKIYGGLVWDLEGEYRALTTPQPHYWLGIHLPMILDYLIDTPLSAVGDTFTLPITIGEALGFSLPPWPAPSGPPPGTVIAHPTVAPRGPVEQLPPPREVRPAATAYPAAAPAVNGWRQ